MSGFEWKATAERPRPAPEPGRPAPAAETRSPRASGAFAEALGAARGASRARPVDSRMRAPRESALAERLDGMFGRLARGMSDEDDSPDGVPPGQGGPLVRNDAPGVAGESKGDAAVEGPERAAALPGGRAKRLDDDVDGERTAAREDGDAATLVTLTDPSPSSASATTMAADVPRAGDTASVREASAIGRLMDELRAGDVAASGRWRFALPGGALGIDAIVLTRGEGGPWNLRLRADKARQGGAQADLDGLRGALRARGHDVGEIEFGDGADGEGAA